MNSYVDDFKKINNRMDIEIDVPKTISALFVQTFPGRQRNRLSLFGYISVWVEDIKEKKD